jgi:hypothetical protein
MSNNPSDIHLQIGSIAKNYHYHEPIPWLIYLRDSLTHAYRWLLDWLSSLLLAFHVEADTRAVGNTMKAMFILAGASAIGLIIVLALRQLKRRNQKAEITPTDVYRCDRLLTYNDWLKKAIEATKVCQWKEACRAVYMACLRLLDERGILPFVATRTNLEVCYALSGNKRVADIFRRLASNVDTIWFGRKEADEEDFHNCLSHFKSIEQEVDIQTYIEP